MHANRVQYAMKRNPRELPGFLSVRGAGERLHLAPRSIRDLIYAGRLVSFRLGRRHYLRSSDVDHERRRRLGLPLPSSRTASVRPRSHAPSAHYSTAQPVLNESLQEAANVTPRLATSRTSAAASQARRQRAEERAALRDRWLRSGQRITQPDLPFTTATVVVATTCDACQRPLRPGTASVLDLDLDKSSDRRSARLCRTCARPTLLAWADQRQREFQAARRLARELGSLTVERVAVAA